MSMYAKFRRRMQEIIEGATVTQLEESVRYINIMLGLDPDDGLNADPEIPTRPAA